MQAQPISASSGQVRKRSVFYISGFDPKGAAHYHALYRDEAAKQAQVSGMSIEVGRRQKTAQGDDFWQVTAHSPEGPEPPDDPVETRYEFLRWDDIVRAHWTRNQVRLRWDIVTTTWLNLRHGALWRMLKLAWPPVVALFSPFALLFAMLLGLPLLASLVFSVASASLGDWGAGALTCISVAAGVQAGRRLEKKYSMFWLMRSYAFTAQHAQGRVPALDARLTQHANTLLNRMASNEDDEILVVAHSSGTIMAASMLAKALRLKPHLGVRGPVVSLLTLGQCMPLLGCLPQAQAFRDDLQLLATARGINWIDFTAPPDGCCFALVDPVAACGINDAALQKNRPKLLSPRFAEMFEPSDYAAIRSDKFRIHFQYLMASSKPVLYDYFAITAGSMTLAKRFSEQPSINDYKGLKLFKSEVKRPEKSS
jgi:hypothetical protein